MWALIDSHKKPKPRKHRANFATLARVRSFARPKQQTVAIRLTLDTVLIRRLGWCVGMRIVCRVNRSLNQVAFMEAKGDQNGWRLSHNRHSDRWYVRLTVENRLANLIIAGQGTMTFEQPLVGAGVVILQKHNPFLKQRS